MVKPIKAVKDNYTLYVDLLYKKKHFTSLYPLTIYTPKKSRPDFILDEFKIKHSTLPDKISLMIEANVNNAKSFKLQLKFLALCETPLFRYDSDGAAHHNRDHKTKIILQKIETPHFNYYDKDGRCLAYLTKFLEAPENAEKVSDINESFKHFCEEAFIETEGDTAIVLNRPGTFSFAPSENTDPLTSVIYFPD